ncbi:hypothetical protein BCR37DRAFT_125163 [Protomyces lactucae-debilis]|uniref:Uncharacterized protein n=1 Tax=Protomyces lactucae-debilis TaxID=2754530 RepID=A0A1Y2FUD1_PROLT|nr:uncharacterized protein BCR37DRAFT_125163 [Protomyces lactucae-debilis]ORY86806.1 hypothetical protein BCR37DRAFT_125163 [Protomyces lactucae-debilis]
MAATSTTTLLQSRSNTIPWSSNQELPLSARQGRRLSPPRQRVRASSLDPRRDMSTALLSPGFSKGTLSNPEKRENLQLSLDVKQQQEELIQARMLGHNKGGVRKASAAGRRAPQRLQLTEATLHRAERMFAQTAPLHGRFPHSNERAGHLLPPIRVDGVSTPDSAGRLLPPLKQHFSLSSQPNPRSAPLTPPTPGTARFDKTNALSVARLQARKERYLTHCAAAFDALYADS